MRISDWSSDVCSSDLVEPARRGAFERIPAQHGGMRWKAEHRHAVPHLGLAIPAIEDPEIGEFALRLHRLQFRGEILLQIGAERGPVAACGAIVDDERVRPLLQFLLRHRIGTGRKAPKRRSEEHTSELQSLMSTSYAVFCL